MAGANLAEGGLEDHPVQLAPPEQPEQAGTDAAGDVACICASDGMPVTGTAAKDLDNGSVPPRVPPGFTCRVGKQLPRSYVPEPALTCNRKEAADLADEDATSLAGSMACGTECTDAASVVIS